MYIRAILFASERSGPMSWRSLARPPMITNGCLGCNAWLVTVSSPVERHVEPVSQTNGIGCKGPEPEPGRSRTVVQPRIPGSRSRLRGDRSKPVWGRFHCCRGTPRSISQPLIDNVLQGFALLKPAILLQKEAHRLILPVGRMVRAVRRQQNILQLVQQMSRR